SGSDAGPWRIVRAGPRRSAGPGGRERPGIGFTPPGRGGVHGRARDLSRSARGNIPAPPFGGQGEGRGSPPGSDQLIPYILASRGKRERKPSVSLLSKGWPAGSESWSFFSAGGTASNQAS